MQMRIVKKSPKFIDILFYGNIEENMAMMSNMKYHITPNKHTRSDKCAPTYISIVFIIE